MTVKELIEELKKYPEDTKIYSEYFDDEVGLTYIKDMDIEFCEKINCGVDSRGLYYSYRGREELDNVLVIK